VSDSAPNKILVVRFSALGDVILVTGALDALRARFPGARIHCVVREDCAAVLEGQPYVDRLWVLPRGAGLVGLWRLGKTLRQERFDVLYDAHRSLRSRLLVPCVRAKRVFRFRKRYLRRFLYLKFRWPTLRRVPPFRRAHVEALRDLDVDARSATRLEASPSASRSAFAKVPLLALPGRRRLAVAPSAAWPLKRWPLEHFRRTVATLVEEDPTLDVVVLGGPSDRFCEELVRGLDPARVANAQGRFSLAESFAALTHVDGLLANDTGLAHAAEALKKPAVFLFGPTTPEIGVRPQHPSSRVAERALWCRPCSKHGKGSCWRGDHACLRGLLPETVLPMIRAMLTEGSNADGPPPIAVKEPP
jgi:lipopolysaccharide heptosyltransferase II